MNFVHNLFKKNAIKNEEKISNSFTEYDNLGTRICTMEESVNYWQVRNISQKFDPFVLYIFDEEIDARNALLELDCIHVAKESGNLICTIPLYFGYYRRDDGKYSAMICGGDLTHELWLNAKDAFTKHNGHRKNDQEPEIKDTISTKPLKITSEQVVFVRETRKQGLMGGTMIYRIYRAHDADSAKAFLQQNPVKEKLSYIIVETPEGNYGRDILGIYRE
jgi:hypothetical protein